MEDITATSNASNPVLIEINEHDTDDNNSEIVGGTDHCSDGVTKVAFKQRPSSRKRNEANMQPKPSPRPAVPLPPSRFPHLRCNQLPTIKEEPAHREWFLRTRKELKALGPPVELGRRRRNSAK
uniref:Uncharacterized protein n=1 Tax=Globodera pallida TaxID=36090 RepID=A0A183BX08_GLOPA